MIFVETHAVSDWLRRLKLNLDDMRSIFAFNSNLSSYIWES